MVLLPTDKLSAFAHKASQGGAVRIYEAKLSHRASSGKEQHVGQKSNPKSSFEAAVNSLKYYRLVMNSSQ